MTGYLRRREFITLLGGATAWPLAARAQQMPVVGFLHPGSPAGSANVVAAFRKGLNEAGFVEGRNVAMEFRWAENDFDRLPELATQLVQRRVAIIATPGSPPGAMAAKAATATIPIVFSIGGDPVAMGLVKSLNRPGGNVTGITSLNTELSSKRIGYLHGLSPTRGRIVLLTNPGSFVDSQIAEAKDGAAAVGRRVEVLPVRAIAEIDAALAKILEWPSPTLLVTPGWPTVERRMQIATWAARHAVPAMYSTREWVVLGGLASYGPDLNDEWRRAGVYTGRILKGENPAELPVYRLDKFELVINRHTAKIIGVEVPAALLALADEVIE